MRHAWSATIIAIGLGCGGSMPPVDEPARTTTGSIASEQAAVAPATPTEGESATSDAPGAQAEEPLSPAEALVDLFEVGATVSWSEPSGCSEWRVERAHGRGEAATLTRDEGGTRRSFVARVEGTTIVVHAPRIGRAQGACRVELHVQSAEARGVATDRGWIYYEPRECEAGRTQGDVALELGPCEGMFALMSSPTATGPRTDSIERALATRGTIHWLVERDAVLECDPWTFERHGRDARMVHVVPTGRETYDVLGHAAGRLEVSGGWEGNDGSRMGIGDVEAWDVRHPSAALALAGGRAWFLRHDDCEAARAAGSAAAWLRATAGAAP